MAEYRARLYLVTPPVGTLADLPPDLGAVLACGDVACLLLRLVDLPERDAKEIVRRLIGLVQGQGTALLLESARLAAHTGADGVHVSEGGEVFDGALDSLKPERIVGVGAPVSRDEAMRLGEAGADYLMFGADGGDPEEILDGVGWWAEIFNVPCVGVATTLEEIEPLAIAGAEFIGLGDAVWRDPRGAAAAVAEAEGILVRVAAGSIGASA